MKLIVPAPLTEQLRERTERLERLANAIANDVAGWRAYLARHRVAVAVLGGGAIGMTLAMRWRSLLRFGAAAVSTGLRAAVLSAIARARVQRLIADHLARASRTT